MWGSSPSSPSIAAFLRYAHLSSSYCNLYQWGVSSSLGILKLEVPPSGVLGAQSRYWSVLVGFVYTPI